MFIASIFNHILTTLEDQAHRTRCMEQIFGWEGRIHIYAC